MQEEGYKNGLVLKSTGSRYKVKTDDGETLDCFIKGKFRIEGIRTTNPLAVGDRVKVRVGEEENLITELFDRKNYIIRKSINLSKKSHILASNIDRAYLVVTLIAPQTHLGFIDRFLVTAEAYSIPTSIIWNKVDLLFPEDEAVLEHYISIYESIGYPCHKTSLKHPETFDFLKEETAGKQFLLSGNSGVGKSSIAKLLAPDLDIKVGKISMTHLAGQHTTTFAEIFELENGGYLIDTPGIKAFGLIDIDKKNLSHYFPEMLELLPECKFNNCVHVNEPGCAVKDAVEHGEIFPERYNSYLSMMEEDQEEDYRGGHA
ncbi:MAG: ribosome small subunit-dependent GTPase A [Crocinitomicaceae bacterium]|nr:ribosome small subunit-dependent GTPase A [Crocinitomicaceae bacterium]